MFARRGVRVSRVRPIGENQMQARSERYHGSFEFRVSKLVQCGVKNGVCARAGLQHVHDFDSKIACKEGAEFWIDAVFELSLELCRRELLVLQITRNEL